MQYTEYSSCPMSIVPKMRTEISLENVLTENRQFTGPKKTKIPDFWTENPKTTGFGILQ